MRMIMILLAGAALAGCALAQAVAPDATNATREQLIRGMELYCQQPQVSRMQNRAWINENSPHTIELTCAGDEAPSS